MVVDRLRAVTEQLMEAHTELAGVLQDERRTKAQAWVSSQEGSVTQRDRIASYEALEATCSRHELEGRIAALKEEQHLLTVLISHAPAEKA